MSESAINLTSESSGRGEDLKFLLSEEDIGSRNLPNFLEQILLVNLINTILLKQ